MSQHRPDFSLPPDMGIRQDSFYGGSDLLVYLVASEAGHPINSEKAAYKVLERLHGLDPLDWVFVNLDGAEKSGHTSYDLAEIDLGAYRAYTDREISKGICAHMIETDMLCAALALGITSEPRVRVQAIDDWHLRAVQSDALEELNAEGGKIALIDALLATLLAEGSPAFRDFMALMSSVRLEWTDGEWLERRSSIEALEPEKRFTELAGLVPQYESVVEHLSFYKSQARRFYEAAISRTGVLADEILRVMQGAGARTAALTVALPWMRTAAERLRTAGVSYISIIPSGVSQRAMLELPSLNPAEVLESNKKLEALFSGRPIPGRIEILEAGQKERRRKRSNDWSAAGQALALKYDFKKADECYQRALDLDPDNPQALYAAGASAVDERQYAKALAFLGKAVRLEPLAARTWEAQGCALDGLRRPAEARKAFLKCIYLEPKNGRYWNRLGLHFHQQGKMSQACYAFKKGTAYKDGMAAQNYSSVFGSSDRSASCPFPLRPFVISIRHWGLTLKAKRRRG